MKTIILPIGAMNTPPDEPDECTHDDDHECGYCIDCGQYVLDCDPDTDMER